LEKLVNYHFDNQNQAENFVTKRSSESPLFSPFGIKQSFFMATSQPKGRSSEKLPAFHQGFIPL